MKDTEIRHDRDLIVMALVLGALGILAVMCCIGGFLWAVFG